MQAQALEDSATLAVDFHHLQAFDEELAGVVKREYYRVEPALRKARALHASLAAPARCIQPPADARATAGPIAHRTSAMHSRGALRCCVTIDTRFGQLPDLLQRALPRLRRRCRTSCASMRRACW